MILQLYIFRQLLSSVGFSVAGIGMIVLPTIAIQAIHKLGAVGLEAVFQYLPLVVVELVPYLLPMAFLLGVVGTYGRLAAERELVAVRMAGIHPGRLTLPALAVAIGLSLWTDHLLANVSPTWKYDQRNFKTQSEADVFRNLITARTQFEFGSHYLIAQRNVGDGRLEEVLVTLRFDGSEFTVFADVAQLLFEEEFVVLRLTNAQVLGESFEGGNQRLEYRLSMDELFPHAVHDRNKPKFMRNEELAERLEEEGLDPVFERDALFEMHRRHALSVTYLLFLLLGVPTGVVLRSSTQLGAFSGAVGFAFLYYVLALRLGKELALAGDVHPIVAAWATDGLFLLVGVPLFFRAVCR